MEVFGVIFAMVAVVASAPTLNKGQVPGASNGDGVEFYRDKRSQYAQYVSPCQQYAAASAPIPAIAPASYQVNVSPYHGSVYGYAVPHYRSVEMEPEQEMLSFSDEHMPMARYGYAQPAAAPSAHAAYTAPAPISTTGPVFGVFPNANTGGCSVPLLLSCQPSIVPGHVVQTQPNYGGDSYRSMDAAAHHEAEEVHHHDEHEHPSTAPEPSHATVHQ